MTFVMRPSGWGGMKTQMDPSKAESGDTGAMNHDPLNNQLIADLIIDYFVHQSKNDYELKIIVNELFP